MWNKLILVSILLSMVVVGYMFQWEIHPSGTYRQNRFTGEVQPNCAVSFKAVGRQYKVDVSYMSTAECLERKMELLSAGLSN